MLNEDKDMSTLKSAPKSSTSSVYIYLSQMRARKMSMLMWARRVVWSKGCMHVNKSVKGQNFLHSAATIRARPELWTLLSARSTCLWPTPPCFPPATASEKTQQRDSEWEARSMGCSQTDLFFFFFHMLQRQSGRAAAADTCSGILLSC